MRYLVSGTQMKEIDAHAIQTIGIPSMVLMERAALAVADAVEKACDFQKEKVRKRRVLIFCGTGNNGADGAAIARILHLRGFYVTVLTVGDEEHRTEEMQQQLSIDEKLGISVEEFSDFLPGSGGVVIDALFGVGLSRDVTGEYLEAVRMIERISPRLTVSVDLPSGIHSDTGKVMGAAVKADLTVTFGFEKLGTVLYPGREYSGLVTVADIGFPAYCGDWKPRFYTYEKSDLSLIPGRKKYSHKGMYGKVLIAAGSKGMCGAAYLSALAAYRTGAGLVKILTVEENVNVLQTLLPEAIISSYSPDLEEREPENFKALVERECDWAGIIVLGPGLGHGRHVAKLLEYVLLSAYVPIILDADGLNTVAEYPYLADYFTENVIVTPHLGEMSRLTGKDIEDIRDSLVETAAGYALKYGITCVLKDAVSVVAEKNGNIYINTSGNASMSKAGSGDVLTGIIAGLLALSFEEDGAAAMGVYLHGVAGIVASESTGEHSLLARDIAEAVMREEKNGYTIQPDLC